MLCDCDRRFAIKKKGVNVLILEVLRKFRQMSSGILTSIRLPSTTRNEDMYHVFRYSHFDLITFDKEKRRHV